MYVESNIQARSCNYCFSGRTMSITYCKYVFVALGIQYVMRMRHTVMCPTRLCKKFPFFFIKFAIFEKKSLNIKYVF